MKAIVLKPIVWNTVRYERPSGVLHSGGFAKRYGYGHEEWNNSPTQNWRGFRIFHTEATKKLERYAKDGELGMILIASHGGKQYAVGVATSVFLNSRDEMKLISKDLKFRDRWKELWELPIVRKRFQNHMSRLRNHWEKHHEWMNWKCPDAEFLTFDSPIMLNPKSISGRSRLVSEHGSFQAIYTFQAIEIIKSKVSKNHPIMKWLNSTDFDDSIISKSLKQHRKVKRKPKLGNRSAGNNSPAQRRFEYWVEGNRAVEPHHAYLQGLYVNHLKEKEDISAKENQNYIDVTYRRKGQLVFSEVKPTENIKTKYAIRAAIGQILEYQYFADSDAELEIVLGSKPTNDESEFLKSLGITLVYYDSGKKTFCRIPK